MTGIFRPFRFGEDFARMERFLRRALALPTREPGSPAETAAAAAQVDETLGRPDAEIDLARATALLAREDDPSIDVERTLESVDALAVGLKERLRGAADARERLDRSNAFFFDELRYRVRVLDREGPARRLEGLLLPSVIARRSGHCLGLSTLYLAVASRAGLPLYGVSAPGHFFCRYEEGAVRVNVETTLRGAHLPDATYVQRYGLTRDHLERGVYLQSLCRRELIVEVLNNRANCWFELGDVERAARDLDRVARASPGFARGFTGRGFLALHTGDLAAAVRELRRAIEIDPGYARAHLHLGDALLRLGRTDEALEVLERAVDLDPRSPLAHTNLGRVHARRGDLALALACHERAIDLDPGCHVAWNNLGVARRADGDVAGARAAFHEALALAPPFLPARENLALIDRGRGLGIRFAFARRAALRAYGRRLRASPQDAALHAALARFLVESGGDRLSARAHAELACALAPGSPAAWESAALVARHDGDPERAAQLLERARATGDTAR